MRFVVLLCGLLLVVPTVFAEEDAEAAPEIVYLPLNPQFTVNLLGDNHYLRTSIQLQLDSSAGKDAAVQHNPALRHTLIVLLSNNKVEDISSVEGQTKLREKAVIALNEMMKKVSAPESITDVFFTDFVFQ